MANGPLPVTTWALSSRFPASRDSVQVKARPGTAIPRTSANTMRTFRMLFFTVPSLLFECQDLYRRLVSRVKSSIICKAAIEAEPQGNPQDLYFLSATSFLKKTRPRYLSLISRQPGYLAEFETRCFPSPPRAGFGFIRH